jgi:hypothetical protein
MLNPALQAARDYPIKGLITMLDYIALGILIFVGITIFYGIIALHDIPYQIAVSRQHPQQDAIHVAGWVSLFTLHVIWPFLWIWAMMYKPERGWGFAAQTKIEERIAELEARFEQFKKEHSGQRDVEK